MHRWIDLATFAPMMRGHEGNRPADNLQLDATPEILFHFARMSQVHTRLARCGGALSDEAVTTELELQRPVFLHYRHPASYRVHDQYLNRPDMLVAPVNDEGMEGREVDLPDDAWIHLWSGEEFAGLTHVFAAPNAQPPVFYRKASLHAPLLVLIGEEFGACTHGPTFATSQSLQG